VTRYELVGEAASNEGPIGSLSLMEDCLNRRNYKP
jgi:hypothetical protein